MDVAITTMSSRGQIVIPAEFREDIKEGEKMVIIRSDGQFIMKKANTLEKNFMEDLEFARRTEEAWKSYERKKFKSMNPQDFFKELKKW